MNRRSILKRAVAACGLGVVPETIKPLRVLARVEYLDEAGSVVFVRNAMSNGKIIMHGSYPDVWKVITLRSTPHPNPPHWRV
jgi:hypothetical protein